MSKKVFVPLLSMKSHFFEQHVPQFAHVKLACMVLYGVGKTRQRLASKGRQDSTLNFIVYGIYHRYYISWGF